MRYTCLLYTSPAPFLPQHQSFLPVLLPEVLQSLPLHVLLQTFHSKVPYQIRFLSEEGRCFLLPVRIPVSYTHLLEQAVRENLKNENLFDQKQMDSMNAAIAKLRVLFGTEHSYENMKNEVREIEKESKNSLCTFLIERIDPEEIGKQVEAEMTEAYGSSFKNKLRCV